MSLKAISWRCFWQSLVVNVVGWNSASVPCQPPYDRRSCRQQRILISYALHYRHHHSLKNSHQSDNFWMVSGHNLFLMSWSLIDWSHRCEKRLSACACGKSGWMVISLKGIGGLPFWNAHPPRTTSYLVESHHSKWFVAADQRWILPARLFQFLNCIHGHSITPELFVKAPASTYQLIAIPNRRLPFFMITDKRTSATIQIYKRCRRPHSSFFRPITSWLLVTPSKTPWWVSWWMILYFERSMYWCSGLSLAFLCCRCNIRALL